MTFDVVIPSLGRPTLARLLGALHRAPGPRPESIVVVDDRPGEPGRLELPHAETRVEVIRAGGRGPAAARNAGLRRAHAEWVVFLDDDVVPPPDWPSRLAEDIEAASPDVAAIQGRVRVPLPRGRRPTDWERNVAALEGARWATADLACRRGVLNALGGFDERFRHAYREDAELAIRVRRSGRRLVQGRRFVTHPIGPAGFWKSVRLQSQNADDALMLALHGRAWRRLADAAPGRRPRHIAITGAALVAAAASLVRRRRLAGAAAAAWATGTAELAWARIAPGPRDREEVVKMLVTSALIPGVATVHWLAGLARWLPARPRPLARRPEAVLLDRDGTLVVDVPYNGDPALVVPMPGAREALERLRRARVPIAMVSNQSGIGRGLVSAAQVEAVNRRIEELLGPLGPWAVCPHRPEDECECRKPQPGLVNRAARQLGVEPSRCALVGDIGADVEAATAAGARAVMVPTPWTLEREIRSAPEVARDLPAAVDLLIGARP